MYIRSRSNSETTVSPVSLKTSVVLRLRQAGEWAATGACVLLVGEVTGVVDPHEFIEAAAPPSGQLQAHMEGVLGLRLLVPPEEPVALNLALLLSEKHNGRRI